MRPLSEKMKIYRNWCAVLLICVVTLTSFPNLSYSQPGQSPSSQQSGPLPQVQLFDMQQERIVKTLPNSAEFQAEAAKWLQSVTGLSPQLNIGSKCGYIVRIALEKPYPIKLPRLDFQIRDVFLIYCPDKKPLLLVFTPERKPYLLEFKQNIQPFMEQLMKPTLPGAEEQ